MNDSTTSFNPDMRVSPKVVIATLLAFSWVLVFLSQSLVEPIKMEGLAILIAALSIVAWALERRDPLLGRWFAVGALAALVLLAHYWLHLPSALAWLAVPTALAAALLSLPAATGIALGEASLLILLSLGRSGSADWEAIGVAMGANLAILGVMFAVYQPVQREIARLEAYFDRAQVFLEQARDRKAELEQALADLANANRQLALAGERMAVLRTMAFTLESNQLNYPIEWIPQPMTTANFVHIFVDKTLPIGRWFLNSLVVASGGTAVIVFLSSLSGFAFARLEFPGKSFLFSLLLFSLMIPVAITLIPTFLLLRDLKLLNTYHAIWWPAAAQVTGIFLMRQHFYSIPADIEDAARIDGAGSFRIYWQVCVPMVTGSMVALFIFSFLGLWNDLFWPLIVLGEREVYTLPVGLVFIQQGSYIQRGLAYAGAFIASAPVLVFYAIFQRRIIAGITLTGMAGQ